MIWRRVNWPTRTWAGSPTLFNELDGMRREMDLLRDSLARGFAEPGAGVFPLVNVTEDSDNTYLRAELPGLKAEELDISVTGNTISISGERTIADRDENAKYHRREREAGTFDRVITLPNQIDTNKVKATCTDGVLTVVLPKAESAKPKQISVKAS